MMTVNSDQAKAIYSLWKLLRLITENRVILRYMMRKPAGKDGPITVERHEDFDV